MYIHYPYFTVYDFSCLQIVTEKTEKYKPMMQAVIIVSFHDVTKNEQKRQQGRLKYHM